MELRMTLVCFTFWRGCPRAALLQFPLHHHMELNTLPQPTPDDLFPRSQSRVLLQSCFSHSQPDHSSYQSNLDLHCHSLPPVLR